MSVTSFAFYNYLGDSGFELSKYLWVLCRYLEQLTEQHEEFTVLLKKTFITEITFIISMGTGKTFEMPFSDT